MAARSILLAHAAAVAAYLEDIDRRARDWDDAASITDAEDAAYREALPRRHAVHRRMVDLSGIRWFQPEPHDPPLDPRRLADLAGIDLDGGPDCPACAGTAAQCVHADSIL